MHCYRQLLNVKLIMKHLQQFNGFFIITVAVTLKTLMKNTVFCFRQLNLTLISLCVFVFVNEVFIHCFLNDASSLSLLTWGMGGPVSAYGAGQAASCSASLRSAGDEEFLLFTPTKLIEITIQIYKSADSRFCLVLLHIQLTNTTHHFASTNQGGCIASA